MGATFAAVHVRRVDLPAVQQAIDQWARSQGLRPADEADADRVIALSPGPIWTAVYDEAADIGDDKLLDAVGQLLSADAVALSVLVHDSDVLQLRLYTGGRKRGFYDSNPDYFGSRRRRVGVKKQLKDFAPLLPQGVAAESLRPVFGGQDLFAEQAVDQLAGLIGADPQRLCVGYRYQAEQGWPQGTVLLRYRDGSSPAPRTGAPALVAHTAGQCMPVAVGGQVMVNVGLRNQGGPLQGFTVQVAGGESLVRWSGLRVSTGDPRQQQAVEEALVDGQARIERTVPGAIARQDLAGLSPHKMLAAMHQGVLYVNLTGTVYTEGTAAVRLTFRQTDGTLLYEQTVSVTGASTEGRPLRASPQVPPLQLAQLDEDRWLNALICCTLPRAQAIERLLPIVQAMQPHLPSDGKVTRTIFPAAGGGLLSGMLASMKSPKMWTGKANSLWRGKGWSKLVEAATKSAAQVELAWGEAEEGPGEGVARMSLGGGIIPASDPCTALSISVREASPQVAAALKTAIDAAVAQGHTGHGGIAQASLTHSGTAVSTEMTLYELCCGISGQCTLMNRWVTRWLRCVGAGTLWVGPELQGHLDPGSRDPDSLAWSPVGDSWRIDVTDRAQVEAALADILPTAEDWQRGMAARYAP